MIAPQVGPLGGLPVRGQIQDKAVQAAQEFEAVFVEMLLRQMRTAAESLGGKQRGIAHDIYGGWFDAAVARHLTIGGGLGLSGLLARQLEKGTSAPLVESDTMGITEEAVDEARGDHADSTASPPDVAGG